MGQITTTTTTTTKNKCEQAAVQTKSHHLYHYQYVACNTDDLTETLRLQLANRELRTWTSRYSVCSPSPWLTVQCLTSVITVAIRQYYQRNIPGLFDHSNETIVITFPYNAAIFPHVLLRLFTLDFGHSIILKNNIHTHTVTYTW